MGRSTTDVLLGAVALVTSTAAVTWKLTKIYEKEQKQRALRRAYEERKAQQQSNNNKEPTFDDSSTFAGRTLDTKIDKLVVKEIESLRDRFVSEDVVNKLQGKNVYNKLIENQYVMQGIQDEKAVCFHRAGPRKLLHFNPRAVNAAIVTCGGLCPGLNNVIREITTTLLKNYQAKNVYGILGGYSGFGRAPRILTPSYVENIHHMGGTILGSSRGGFDIDVIMNFLAKYKISHLYIIGGDGTHRGAFRIHEECVQRNCNISVVGIPKTIDNDISYIDSSFGFQSAVAAAVQAIRSAKTEAICNLPNGIGVVKLMGRSAGFIAAHATLSSADVDLCLVPEVPVVLEGENSVLEHLYTRVKQQGFGVVVVAEGAGEELLGTSQEVDASGNKRLPKIGEFMKKTIEQFFVSKNDTATVKYIDPSYLIRSVPANASDSLYCMQLAQNAVHGAMAGFTGFSVGITNNKLVFIPIPDLVEHSPRSMNPKGRTWERVFSITGQPNPVDKIVATSYHHPGPIVKLCQADSFLPSSDLTKEDCAIDSDEEENMGATENRLLTGASKDSLVTRSEDKPSGERKEWIAVKRTKRKKRR